MSQLTAQETPTYSGTTHIDLRTTHVPTSHPTWRAAGVIGLIGIAAIHLADLPSKLSETPYLGWMYIGMIAACAFTAGALVWTTLHRVAWAGAAAIAASAFVGYCLSRTTGLPGATGDIGNWGEPLGVASLVIEAAVVIIALGRLRANAALSLSTDGRS